MICRKQAAGDVMCFLSSVSPELAKLPVPCILADQCCCLKHAACHATERGICDEFESLIQAHVCPVYLKKTTLLFAFLFTFKKEAKG